MWEVGFEIVKPINTAESQVVKAYVFHGPDYNR
jgi:hypothetical protein